MKTYEEMAQSALRRIETELAAQRRRKKRIRDAITAATGICLAAALVFCVWRTDLLRPNVAAEHPSNSVSANMRTDASVSEPQHAPEEETDVPVPAFPPLQTPSSPAELPEPVPPITADSPENESKDSPQIESSGSDDPNQAGSSCGFWWENRLVMSGMLYQAIRDDPDGEWEIRAVYHPATAEITSFLYEGKTLGAWAEEAYAADVLPDAKEGYRLAYDAYLETVLPAAVSRMTEGGISCRREDGRKDALVFSATVDVLKKLPLEQPENWRFDLSETD